MKRARDALTPAAAGRLAALAMIPALTSCERADPLAPPRIYFGEDVCEVCGMIISDERFAAAAITQKDAGYAPALFDDIGCMLAFETDGPDGVVAHYVRAIADRRWLDADDAIYVHSDGLHTPMAFGVAAAGDGAEAAALLAEYPGQRLSWAELVDRFDRGELRNVPRGGGSGASGGPSDPEG